MAYTPGSLTRLLESNVKIADTGKQTKLQALFNKPVEQLSTAKTTAHHKYVKPETCVLASHVKDSDMLEMKHELERSKVKSRESPLVLQREEGLRNADLSNTHKKPEIKREYDNDRVKTLKEINAENAQKRLANKSSEELVSAESRRDTANDDRTVFVGNVALSVQKKALLRLFRTCGKVQTVRIRSAPVADLKLPKKASVIKQQFHPSRHTANAYVVFETPAEAREALSLNGAELEGFHIRVDLAAVQRHDQQKSVFVGNLPFDAQEEDLRTHFTECGEICNVRIIRDKVTAVGKGFGYVTFSNSSSVSLALSLNNQSFNGRQLRVQRSTDRPKQQAKQRSDKKRYSEKNTKPVKQRKSREEGFTSQNRRLRTQPHAADKMTSDVHNRKTLTAKAAGDRKKQKEQRKKKLRKRTVERKKESLGQLLTKQRKS